MNIGAVIVGKQNRYMRRFESAGATNAGSARSLEDLECRGSLVFQRLVSRRVFVEAANGRYYIDLDRAGAFRVRRRVVLLATTVVVLTVMILWMWIR